MPLTRSLVPCAALRRLASVPRFVPLVALVVVVLLLGTGSAGATRMAARAAARRARRRQDTARRRRGDRPGARHLLPRDPQVGAGRRRHRRGGRALDDRFSNYFDPERVQALQGRAELRVLGRRPAGLARRQGAARRRGLRRLAGQARRAAPGRRHRRRRRARPGRQVAAGVRRPRQGPARQRRRADLVARRQARDEDRLALDGDGAGRRARSCAPSDGCKVGVVRLAQFSSGAHAEVYAALRKLQKRGAKGIVFDLRGNGGGLVSEAQLIASAFLKDGQIVTTRGRAVPEQTLRADRRPGRAQGAARRARRRRHARRRRRSSPARCRTATARRSSAPRPSARASSRRSSSCPTAARSTSPPASTSRPAGRNLGGKGVAHGQGAHARRAGQGRPEDARRDEALDRALAVARRREVPVLTDAPPRVVLLEQRGRFLVGEPFFERGRRATVERSRDARPGRLALLRPQPRRAGAPRSRGCSAAPTSPATSSRR